MKYLCWVLGDYFGGCEAYALRMVERAKSAGWKVRLACVHGRCAREFEKRSSVTLPIEPIPSWLLNSRANRKTTALEFLFCVKLLLAVRADVVHAVLPWHECGLNLVRACSWLKQPLLVTFQLVPSGMRLAPRYIEVFRKAKDRGACFSAISENNKRLICDYFGFSQADVPVIYNRPDLSRFMPLDLEQRKHFRQGLEISEDQTIILTVGGLREQKGYDMIVPGIPEIVRMFPDTTFVWVGDGEQRSRLTELLAQYEVSRNVHMLGHRDDVPQLLGAADLFLFPTRFEGESFALCEAAACGLPIVASKASGIPELLRDGEDAFLFPVEDTKALVQAVKIALANPHEARRRGISAKKRLALYTEEDMFRESLILLKRVAQSS